MSLMTHLRHHAAPAPVITEIPPLLWAEMVMASPVTVHRKEPQATRTACRCAVWPFWQIDLQGASRFRPVWCEGCWPGQRCDICARPSGLLTECPACLGASLDVDKRIERSTP